MITRSDSSSPGASGEFGYQPALDGLRALAVAAVLGFHLEVGWMTGGYLGVSIFFTLSGFLITSLLLVEHRRKGGLDLPGFYQRRARRLIPAGLMVIALVCVAVAVGLIQAPSTFRRDVIAAMLQVLNWDQLFSEQSYADLFRAPSPVLHYWSLGIEEQFYVFWPLLFVIIVGVLRRRSKPESLLAVVVALWIVCAISAPLTARWWSPDAAYYATWARASEVLAGAVLAVLLTRRAMPRWLAWLAPLALAAIAVLVVSAPSGHGWAFEGGLPLFSVVSVLLVASLQLPGPVTRMLSIGPLVWLGKISYGLYLFHWALFLILDEDRTGLDGLTLITVRLAATVAAAAVSYSVVEHPIRIRRVLPSVGSLTVALGGAMAVVLVLALSVEVPSAAGPAAAPTLISAAATTPTTVQANSGATEPLSTDDAVTTTTSPPGPTVMAILGDSVPAWLLRDGVPGFTRFDVVLVNGAVPGCDGMIDIPPVRSAVGDVIELPDDCEDWGIWYPKVLDELVTGAGGPVSVAVIMVGTKAALDHQVEGVWTGPCEDLDWYVADLEARFEWLRAQGVEPVFAMPPQLGSRSLWVMPRDHPHRVVCVRAALTEMVERNHVLTVDLGIELCPAGDCEALRSNDGVHVDPEHALEVLDWLVDQSLALVASQTATTATTTTCGALARSCR